MVKDFVLIVELIDVFPVVVNRQVKDVRIIICGSVVHKNAKMAQDVE
jgi:hypothetical protein